ncbi:hypothetical protein SDC9_76747 [bioreactor metagenome]|uniref:Uncharacterized protein n=1 Tax=bioreactor metagenome TaxID=1076179 RepID=A0A644YPF8_9ZZZZ
MLDHRGDRRQAGPAGHHHDRALLLPGAQDEPAVRSGQLHGVAHRGVLEQPPIGRDAAGHVAHLELDDPGLGRRIRHRPGAVDAVGAGDDDLHVLAGVEADLAVQLDPQPLDLVGDVGELDDRAGEVLHREDLQLLLDVDVGLDRHVALRAGAAGEGLALLALEVHQREARGGAVVDLAVEDLHLAGRTGAVGAGVRQPHTGPQAGLEDGLVVGDLDLAAERFNGDGVAHGVPAVLSVRRAGAYDGVGGKGSGPKGTRTGWGKGEVGESVNRAEARNGLK